MTFHCSRKTLLVLFLCGILSTPLFSIRYKLNINNKGDIIKVVDALQKEMKMLKIGSHVGFLNDLYSYLNGYHGYFSGLELYKDRIYLRVNGTIRVLYCDYNKEKSFREKLNHADLRDVLSDVYTSGKGNHRQIINHDPGRYRNYTLLSAVYGKSERQIKKNLVKVKFVGHTLLFNKLNDAASALYKVGKDLEAMLIHFPEYKKYLRNIGETYVNRRIKNSKNMSGHAYGIAIDLNLKKPYYWLDEIKVIKLNRKHDHTIPNEIVEIFEKNGFIWGGKWYHYDKIHFEYRPEFFPYM